jgi:phospholipid/cholesterol/gamma-HCH transport system substrate-binding protein
MREAGRPKRQVTALQLGKIFVGVAGVAAAALFQKADLAAMMRPGETVDIHFAEAHRLRPSVSEVKIAGVGVGIVRSVDREDDGSTTVSVKVDDDVLDSMGTSPSALIRPATVLGGNYYVEIVPGGRRGEFSGSIPMERTSLPVELDGLTGAFPARARQGARTSTKALDETLGSGGARALRDLVRTAPATLDSTSEVLRGFQGTRPHRDLRTLVPAVESTSRVFSGENVRLGAMIDDLATTVRVLDARRHDLALVSRTMPGSLDETARLLDRLDGVLDSLDATAEPARPAVRELARLLEHTDPVLVRARPVVRKLRGVLRDAQPLVRDLVPISSDFSATVGNVRGPVLDRLNGPILDQVLSPWRGTGEYAGGGADRPLYKELGYMFANLTAANMMDTSGSMISFLPGAGPGSLSGLPFSLEEFLSEYRQGAGQ